MRFGKLSLLVTFMAAAAFAQPPNLTSVENAASNRPGVVPSSALAQGSMVVFKGEHVGPASFIVDSEFPLGTVWEGVSVAFTVEGVTTTGIIYYAGPTQVAAVMPSATPVGEGSATLTYQGQTSAPFPITVVRNNIAIYTLNSSGAGPAVATGVRSTGEQFYILPGDSAHPGDTVIFWANGLGPVSFEETLAAPGGDMTEVPLEVFVGGKPADLLYRGRDACCTSVDVVYVRIPQGVAGCATPVLMRIGTFVSNTVTIPVAETGPNCTPTNPYLSQQRVNQIIGQTNATYGTVNLARTTTESPAVTIPGGGSIPDIMIPAMTTVTDVGGGNFVRILAPPEQYLSRIADILTFGTCTVDYYPNGQTLPFFGLPFETLDAGEAIEFQGAAGFRTASRQVFQGNTNYSGIFGNDMEGLYIDPGSYTASWTGGVDVGPASVTISLPEHLDWTNRGDLETVNRAQGLTVEWTGGDPNGWVQIIGSGVAFSTESKHNVVFTCVARVSDGQFTVPPQILLLLPPTVLDPSTAQLAPGQLSVNSFTPPVEFMADGIDIGVGLVNSNMAITLTWQ